MSQLAAKPESQHVIVRRIDPDAPIGNVDTWEKFVKQPGVMGLVIRAASKHLKPERLASMVSVAISRNPQLMACTPRSMFQAAIDAALCGCVTIGGANARGYIIPYKNGRLSQAQNRDVYEAQFQTSYLGMCDMARRSGEVATVEAFAVYDGDTFDYDQGLTATLVHKPSSDPKQIRNKSTLRYVYAIARYKSGVSQFRVLTIAEVEEHRARSKAARSNFWTNDYIPMALKTAVRVLCKWLPQTPEMLEQEAREIERDSLDNSLQIPAAGDRTEELAKMLTAPPAEPAAPPPDWADKVDADGVVRDEPKPAPTFADDNVASSPADA